MGLLIDGVWHDQWYDTAKNRGRYERSKSQFRNWVTADGSSGPTGEDGFAAEPGRYHLYVSYACPWAHRTLIFREIKGLNGMIDVSVVHPLMLEHGWTFDEGSGVIPDPIHGATYLHQVYTVADGRYSGRVTVPVLWDKARDTIVSNESAEIIQMFNGAFDDVGATAGDYYPEPLRDEIDAINERVYRCVNNGVYRAGFATAQDAYDEAIPPLFACLDWLEDLLGRHRYLTGDAITEADWRLFTTLLRFDPVYHGHFKYNLHRLRDYPNLWGFTCDLFQQSGVAGTVHMDHIKTHYYASHRTINPTAVVPMGPEIDYSAPHGRG